MTLICQPTRIGDSDRHYRNYLKITRKNLVELTFSLMCPIYRCVALLFEFKQRTSEMKRELFANILLCVVLVADSTSTRGVQTKNLNFYSGTQVFRCLDGSFEIPMSHVNDEYCDCADGSDEPGTPACTFDARFGMKDEWRFQCSDTAFLTKEILHSHINDGICDCCDGSDEYASNARCPNTCAEAHKKAAAERAEREAKRQLGLQARTLMLEEARLYREKLKGTLEGLQLKVSSLANERDAAESAKNIHEAAEVEERAKIKENNAAEFELWKTAQETKKAELEELKKLQPQENEVIICSKWRQTKDCIGSGERASQDDKECDVVIADGWSGYCDCFDTESNNEVRYEFDCGHKPLRCNYVCTHNGGEPETVEDEKEEEFKMDDGSSYEHPDARDAREKLQVKQRELDEVERTIKNTEDDLARDFGADDAMLSLKGKCFELEQREYTYKMCPFTDVQQIRKSGGHGTNMGRWKSFGEQSYSSWGSKQDYSHFLFADGEHCWGGPHRSTDVHAVCGAENKLVSVEEPSMCTYKMVFETPAVCE